MRLLSFLLIFVPSIALAQDCRLALALALDVSSSIDSDEYQLQRDGVAAALLSEDVQAKLLADNRSPVALAIYEFSGSRQHALIIDWVILKNRETIFAVAKQIANSDRSEHEFPTAIGYALGYAAALFARAPECWFQKLDVSGDGRNNFGFAPHLAYKHFRLRDITVNGLVVGGAENLDDLVAYYRTEVLHGPDAFVVVANSYETFGEAMRRKLLREIETLVIGRIPD